MMNDISNQKILDIDFFLNSYGFLNKEQKYGVIELIIKIMEHNRANIDIFVLIIKALIEKHPEVNKKIRSKGYNEITCIIMQFKIIKESDLKIKNSNGKKQIDQSRQHKESKISKIIDRDDVDSFQQIMSEPGFDINDVTEKLWGNDSKCWRD